MKYIKLTDGMKFTFTYMNSDEYTCVVDGQDVRMVSPEGNNIKGHQTKRVQRLINENGTWTNFKHIVERHVHADVMIAYANDKSLVVETKYKGGWTAISSPSFMATSEYRIKPEKSDELIKAEELLADAENALVLAHDNLLKVKNES